VSPCGTTGSVVDLRPRSGSGAPLLAIVPFDDF
jgi:hypothetical protein